MSGQAADRPALHVLAATRLGLRHPCEGPRTETEMRGGKPAIKPCVPAKERRAIFFVHIPKTAGTSVNRAFAEAYGPRNVALHVEDQLPRLIAGRMRTLRADFVSGHVPFGTWARRAGAGAYAPATLFRDPWRRLVSHINHVDAFDKRPVLRRFNRVGRQLGGVQAALREVDFEDRASLLRLRDRLDAMAEGNTFDNCQFRMILPAQSPMRRRLREGDEARALGALGGFAHVGFSEALDTSLAALSELAGTTLAPRQENRARSSRLSAQNDLAREILSPWWQWDAALVDAARSLVQDTSG